MILRPIAALPSDTGRAIPIWDAILATQQQKMEECWLIPQPAHSALSGDIAAQLNPEVFPGLNAEIIHAFALHDAGWSFLDAAAIQESRAKGAKAQLRSFFAVTPAEAISAWTASIEIVAKYSDTGALLVSRHFSAISESAGGRLDLKSRKAEEAFRAGETQRQEKLRKKIFGTDAILDRMFEALQFCDLASLYLCCGTKSSAVFPQKIAGKEIVLKREGLSCICSPSPFQSLSESSISAIRHPKTSGDSGTTFTLQMS